MNKVFVKIAGMSCNHCQQKIRKELLDLSPVKKVDFKKQTAIIYYDKDISYSEVVSKITKAGYVTDESKIFKDQEPKINLLEFVSIFSSFLLIFFSLKTIFGVNIFNLIPRIENNITYGLLFVTGLLTSLHCISMCGAINLYASIGQKQSFKKPLFYNLGRLTSYTIMGGIFGLIGSFFSINYYLQQIILLLAGILMLVMALSMLGICDFNLQKYLPTKFKSIKTKNTYLIGLLNGLMPCGPLQAMQIYALSTGSFVKGALSLLLFGLGTVPLMLTFGLLINFFKGKGKVLIHKVSLVLFLFLSLMMINRGLLGFGIDLTKEVNRSSTYYKASVVDDYQYLEFDLRYDGYQNIVIQKNVPVKIIIHVDKDYLTGCNNKVVIPEYGISETLEAGDNVITFTPTKVGSFTYGCWMNMIKNSIKVIDDQNYFLK